MRKLLLIALLAFFGVNISHAQRFTDALDRGIVAVNLNGQVFVSWRILPEEYYGTTYNLYKNGSLVQGNLSVSNWTGSGNASDNFTVAAVVNGETGEMSSPAKVWNRYESNLAGGLTFTLSPIVDRNNRDVTHHYLSNDAIFADLDGDGQLEFIIKRINQWDQNQGFPENNTTEYTIWEAYDVNWAAGTISRMWWMDTGPNMVSGSNFTETNLLAYDWDMDGKAEVIMRGADNMIIHHSNGTTETIGSTNVNTRNTVDHNNVNQAYTNYGNEYLIYLNGQTGVTYSVTEYPLKRLESGETDLSAAWGDGYGHRSSKYFMGAPYLDGRKPSIFLARGIYTRHKMIALDVSPSNHALTTRWEWHGPAHGTMPGSYWYGNGNHNYVIADVDEDGRDEIVYGNMVIDDNGKGLNSTAYGHGDAIHVNDFDPYRKGLEIYNCLEDSPEWGMAYRSGLTGEIYKHFSSPPDDDGRALAGNFANNIPGSLGRSWFTDALGLSCDEYLPDFTGVFSGKNDGVRNINFRIYWDGDLLSEAMDGTGSNDNGSNLMIYHWNGSSNDREMTMKGTSNNGTKNNPSFQGDIIGDWREEVMMRASSGATVTEDGTSWAVWDQLLLFTTAYPSSYPIYNLWGDHQYRQAMGTQMQVYNLPPNASFFLGELEGITQAPPPLLNRGRVEVRNGDVISTTHDGEHVMLAATGNAQVNVASGANPKIFTDNAPWWVQGNNASEAQNLTEASTTVYTHTLTGAPFTGETMVVKQGGGILVLPGGEQTYTGDTKVWAGTLQYDGKMTNSPVWLNRFAALSSTGGEFKNVTAEYGAEIQPGGTTANVSEITIENLTLGFGSRVVFDLNGKNVGDNDQIHVTNLTLETKTDAAWVNYGPKNLKPVFQFNLMSPLPGGRYPIGTYVNSPQYALLSDIIVDGIDASRNPTVLVDGGIIYLEINDMPVTSEPEIAIIDMVQTDLTDLYPSSTPTSYYMPKVGVTVAEMNGVKPSLSGEFTDLYGNVTVIESTPAETYYNIDYTANGSASDWNQGGNGQCTTTLAGDGNHGNYVKISCSGSGSRYTNWNISANPVTAEVYTVEFEAALGYSNTTSEYDDNELVLHGGVPTASKWYRFDGTNYFFRITGGKMKGTTYTVNGDSKTITMGNLAWAQYKITVDQSTKKVSYQITCGNNSITGEYTVDASVSTNMSGIFMSLSRASTGAYIDNIKISSPEYNFSEFTFERPGTLRVTATGDASTTPNFKTFIVENPYVKLGGIEEYYGEDFEGGSVPSQWKSPASNLYSIENWYGDQYLYYEHDTSNNSRSAYCDLSSLNIESNKYMIDFDATLRPGNKNGTVLAKNQIALLAGNRPADTAYATEDLLFSAINEGEYSTAYTVSTSDNQLITIPSEEWCHYHFVIDKTQRTIEWTITNYHHNNEIVGEGSDVIPEGTGTDVKYIYFMMGRYNGAFGIDDVQISEYSESSFGNTEYLPVSVHDELISDLPNAVTDGNAHIWRNGLSTTTTWASLVLPFDMTSDQITEVFGENAVVANLVTNMGNEKQLYFETDSRTIHANEPVLIKNVTNAAPYLIRDITSNPVAVPVVQNELFQYIGNYDNKGSIPFYHNVDYFFSNNALSTVATDGTYMTLKGYRGYFHANGGAEASISVLFDDPSGVRDLTTSAPKTFNVYSLSGQMIRRNATSLQGLSRGVYIVNGKKYLVR